MKQPSFGFFAAKKRESEAPAAPKRKEFKPSLFLSGVNTPVCVQLLINAPEFVLGKSDACNGVLAFNDEISREHCKILWRDGQYYLVDLNSTNSTCLNDEVLTPNREYSLHAGDRLRLSASTFVLEQIYSRTER